MIQVIQPPAAILPHDAAGNLNFSADNNAITGRGSNQGEPTVFERQPQNPISNSEHIAPLGLEGLTLDPKTKTLYAMLQSPTFQDGASASKYTRLLAYDVSEPDDKRPKLIGEWVVPLPLTSKGKTLGSSEIHFVKNNVFLSLTRDGDGRGGDDAKSKYK